MVNNKVGQINNYNYFPLKNKNNIYYIELN